MNKRKRQHKGAIASARLKFLREKLNKGMITKEEYNIAANGKRKRMKGDD